MINKILLNIIFILGLVFYIRNIINNLLLTKRFVVEKWKYRTNFGEHKYLLSIYHGKVGHLLLVLYVTIPDDKLTILNTLEYYPNGDIGISIQPPMPNFPQSDFTQIFPDIGYRTIFQRKNYNREYHRNYFNYINDFYYQDLKNHF